MDSLHSQAAEKKLSERYDLETLDASGIIDPFDEELFWRRYFRAEPYYDPLLPYERYAVAYRVGIYHRLAQNTPCAWDAVEGDLHVWWLAREEQLGMPWERAVEPIRAAWSRVNNALSWRQ